MNLNNIYSLCQYSKIWQDITVIIVGTFVNTSPDEIILSKHRHIVEMEPVNASDKPLESLTINEIMYKIDSDQVNTKLGQTLKFTQNFHFTQNESTNEPNPIPKTLIIMPGAIQMQIQVSITDANISKETKDKTL